MLKLDALNSYFSKTLCIFKHKIRCAYPCAGWIAGVRAAKPIHSKESQPQLRSVHNLHPPIPVLSKKHLVIVWHFSPNAIYFVLAARSTEKVVCELASTKHPPAAMGAVGVLIQSSYRNVFDVIHMFLCI